MRIREILSSFSGGVSPLLNIDLLTSSNLTLLNASGGVSGLAQKLDNTFQSFGGGVLRNTNKGAMIEPASQNFCAASSDLNNAAWSVSSTFAGKVAKTSLIPGQTAYEFESDATAGLLNQGSRGVFAAGPETLWSLVEAMPSAVDIQFYIADQTQASAAIVRCAFNFQTKVFQLLGGLGTSQLFGYIDMGPGQNGGTVYLMFCQAVPPVPGNTRRIFCWPNGNSTGTPGRKVTIHHFQDEPGAWITSPIVNPSTTSNTRAVETMTISVPTGTYDVRFTMYDGTNDDRFGVASASNLLTVPTDNVADASLQLKPRNGSIRSISIWPQAAKNIHVLGDSFATYSVATYIIPKWLHIKLYRPRIWTIDGVGGSSLTQQADRFDLTPQFYGDVLVIMDGGLESTFVQAQAAIDRMVAHLTGNKQWLYVEPGTDANFPLGSPTHTSYLTITAQIKAAYPNNYVDTKAFMLSHGDGSANDNTDIANDVWPRSLRFDSAHPNELGSMWYSQPVCDAIYAKRY